MTMQPEQIESFAPGRGGFVAFAEELRLPIGGYPRFGDVMSAEQRDVIRSLAPCVEALVLRQRPPKRGLWCEAIKKWGKDHICALAVLYVLAFAPWAALVQIGADDQGQAGELKRAIDDWLRANVWLSARVDSQRWRLVNQATGACCEILTTDPTGAHGARPDFLCINEITHIRSEEYALTLADNFAGLPNAFGLFATNAGYTGQWPHKWREIYRQDPRWLFVKITETPPWQTPADIEEARRRNPPSRFRRLFLGEWVAGTGDALPPELIERAIVHTTPLLTRDRAEWNLCGIGVDAGIATHHSAIVVLLGSHKFGKLRVANVVDMPPPTVLERLKERIFLEAGVYGVRVVAVDPWQMLRVAEELRACGLYVTSEHMTGNVLTKQAGAMLQAFQDGVIELYNDGGAGSVLIEDIYAARIAEKSYGHRVESDENEHGHGDRLSALLNILPAMLEVLGQPPTVNRDNTAELMALARRQGLSRSPDRM